MKEPPTEYIVSDTLLGTFLFGKQQPPDEHAACFVAPSSRTWKSVVTTQPTPKNSIARGQGTVIEPHSYFEPLVRKQRNLNRVAAVVMLVVCGVGAAWGFSLGVSEHSTARMAAASIIGLPVALFVLLWSFRTHRALALLREPSSIVWYNGVQKGGQVNAVMVGFDNGKLFRFPLPLISMKKGFSQDAFAHLRASAPHAASGFTEERRKACKRDPCSLRR